MLTIKQFLKFFGLDTTKNIKIARHQDTREVDVIELYATGHFDTYQAYQEKNQYKCDYLVSCLGIENNQAIFVGVYKINNYTKINGLPNHLYVPYRGKAKLNVKFYYDYEKLTGFEDLENRLVIQWEGVAQAWCRLLDDTYDPEIVQLLPKGYQRDFPGYLAINLNYKQLRGITNDPIANKIWHKMLSSVGGVYLILDTEEGLQYVGSASGKEGILGRWKEYAKNGHGGNKKLEEILAKDPDRLHQFRYTILQTFPNSLTPTEIVAEERRYKEKLGSRAYGLNLN